MPEPRCIKGGAIALRTEANPANAPLEKEEMELNFWKVLWAYIPLFKNQTIVKVYFSLVPGPRLLSALVQLLRVQVVTFTGVQRSPRGAEPGDEARHARSLLESCYHEYGFCVACL